MRKQGEGESPPRIPSVEGSSFPLMDLESLQPSRSATSNEEICMEGLPRECERTFQKCSLEIFRIPVEFKFLILRSTVSLEEEERKVKTTLYNFEKNSDLKISFAIAILFCYYCQDLLFDFITILRFFISLLFIYYRGYIVRLCVSFDPEV